MVAVADALRTEVRVTDVVGRVGGDEFAIVLPGTTLAGAETHARRISRMLARQCDPAVALSIGMAELDPGGPTASRLLPRRRPRALPRQGNRSRTASPRPTPAGTPVRLAS